VSGGGAVLPCPFKSARTIDFDFSQWFARIVLSGYFLYPFDAMLEDLILPSYVSSVISSSLFQVFLRYQAFGFAYFRPEEGLPSVMLSNQLLEGGSEV